MKKYAIHKIDHNRFTIYEYDKNMKYQLHLGDTITHEFKSLAKLADGLYKNYDVHYERHLLGTEIFQSEYLPTKQELMIIFPEEFI